MKQKLQCNTELALCFIHIVGGCVASPHSFVAITFVLVRKNGDNEMNVNDGNKWVGTTSPGNNCPLVISFGKVIFNGPRILINDRVITIMFNHPIHSCFLNLKSSAYGIEMIKQPKKDAPAIEPILTMLSKRVFRIDW
jgi:hypothetical protein